MIIVVVARFCLGKYHVSCIDCSYEIKQLPPLVQAKRNASLSGSFVAIIQPVRQIILFDVDTRETLGDGYIYSTAYVNSILPASRLSIQFTCFVVDFGDQVSQPGPSDTRTTMQQ